MKRILHENEQYPCPVCRQGAIHTLTLMDAFACQLCHHIFSSNFEHQTLQLADSHLSLTWYWNGRRWQRQQTEANTFGWFYGLAALAFVLLPPTVIALSAYYFPPLPGETIAWFPIIWTGITFCAHFACIAWLVIEYYQFPVRLYLRTLYSRWLSQWLNQSPQS